MRKWLKTNPNVNALYESLLRNDQFSSNTTRNSSTINDTNSNNIISFSMIQEKYFCNLVCQICAICSTKKTKFLVLWDGTKTKYTKKNPQRNTFK